MTQIVPARNIVQQEEVDNRSAISEGTWTRLGATLNLISLRQYDTHGFFLNGKYQFGAGSIGVDGFYPVLFDIEIVAITVFNMVTGSSGTTTLDLKRMTASGTIAGSIFSTLPSISTSAPSNAYAIRELVTPVDYTSAGITLPVLNQTTLDAGEALRFDFISAMTNGENAGLLIHFRPR